MLGSLRLSSILIVYLGQEVEIFLLLLCLARPLLSKLVLLRTLLVVFLHDDPLLVIDGDTLTDSELDAFSPCFLKASPQGEVMKDDRTRYCNI